MSKPGDMQFKYQYGDKESVNKAYADGKFAGNIKSYIGDGAEAFQNEMYGDKTRQQTIEAAKKNLEAQMRKANEDSKHEADEMRARHTNLRLEMQASLERARSASREKKKLEAKLNAEKAKGSAETANSAMAQMEATIRRQRLANDANKAKRDIGNGVNVEANTAKLVQVQNDIDDKTMISEGVSLEGKMQIESDLQELEAINREAEQNQAHGTTRGMFTYLGKLMARRSLNKDIDDANARIEAEKQNILRQADKWNTIREREHHDTKFRKYYEDYDNAAVAYKMLNRADDGDESFKQLSVKKRVSEYVGVFDKDRLEDILEKVPYNPYLTAENVTIKSNKEVRAGSTNTIDTNFVKSHTKITMLSEANADGLRSRYKFTDDFKGYAAAKQFTDKNHPTALEVVNANNPRLIIDRKHMRLKIDERDARNNFIDSEGNIEIVQGKKDKWFGDKVYGIYLNGIFINANKDEILNKKDVKLKKYNFEKLDTKADIRRAVLKAKMFDLINSRSIQHMAGYGAGGGAKKKIKGLAKSIAKELMKENNRTEDENVEDLMNSIFSNAYEDELLAADKKDHKLPNVLTDKWEKDLVGDDEEKKKKVTSAMGAKVVFDVLRQEYKIADDKAAFMRSLGDDTTRAGKLLSTLKSNRDALKDAAILLLSNDDQPAYWEMARYICGTVLNRFRGNRFSYSLDHMRGDGGQLLRVALLDELNADRSHFNMDDPLGFMTPTKWKQMRENVDSQRGAWAIFKQKLTNGSITTFANDVFGSVVDTAEAFDPNGVGLGKVAYMVQTYTSCVAAAVDMGAIAEVGAYAIADKEYGLDYHYASDKDREKDKKTYDGDAPKGTIAIVAAIAKNLLKLAKTVYKNIEKEKKEIEKKKKNEPDYDPKPDMAVLNNRWMKFTLTLIGSAAAVAQQIGKSTFNKPLKNIASLIKNVISVVQSSIDIREADALKGRINDMDKEFETALSHQKNNVATDEEKDMLKVLGENSQLQYGLSCAKSHAKTNIIKSGFRIAKNGIKSIISAVKVFFPETLGKDTAFKVVDAVAGTVVDGVEMVAEMARNRSLTKDTIAKMLGKKYRDVDTSLFNDVLRREVGIVNKDYLTDLAKIFMSINTHVFLKKAGTDAEKTLGHKIVQALFNNKKITKDDIGKVDIGKLMGIMGVTNNYHKIIKHSLKAKKQS